MDFRNYYRFLSQSFYRHLNAVFNEFDAVDDQTSEWARKGKDGGRPDLNQNKDPMFNRTFLYLTLLHLLSNSLGYFGLEWESTGGFTLAGALSHPYILSRQILPRHLGLEGDIAALINAFAAACILLGFIFTPPLARKHRFLYNGTTLQLNGRKLDGQVGEEILAFRRTTREKAYQCCVVYFSCAFICLYTSVYLNNVYLLSPFSLVFWITIFPTYVGTCVLAIFGLSLFLITTTRYIEIRQMAIIGKIAKLREDFLKSKGRKVPPPPRALFHRSWTAFSPLNGQVSSLGDDILEYSRFWWLYLTLIFPSYIGDLSYLFYIVAFNQTVPLLRKAFFFLPAPYFFALIYFIIYRCARVVQMNNLILRENGRFRMALIRKFTFLPVSVLLKSELLLESKRLHPFAFHYLTNIRITPRTFETIISSMAIFCLLVFKNPHLAIE